MLAQSLDPLRQVRVPENDEPFSKVEAILKNELEAKSHRIYQLIQENEAMKFEIHSLSFQQQSLKLLTIENNALRNQILDRTVAISKLTADHEAVEKRLRNEIEVKTLEIQKLSQRLRRSLEEIEMLRSENEELASLETENARNLEDMKQELNDRFREKTEIFDHLIAENAILEHKSRRINEFEVCEAAQSLKAEENNKRMVDCLYKEIDYLKERIIDYEEKAERKKNEKKRKLDQMKKKYFECLETYESRHMEELREMMELKEGNDREVRRLTVEREELLARMRMMEESRSFDEGERVKKLEEKLITLELSFKESKKETLKKAQEIEKLKNELNFAVEQKAESEKKLRDYENANCKSQKSSICCYQYDDSDPESEAQLLEKLRKAIKSDKLFEIMQSKVLEIGALRDTLKGTVSELEALKKENLMLGYEILRLQKLNLELERKVINIPEKEEKIKEVFAASNADDLKHPEKETRKTDKKNDEIEKRKAFGLKSKKPQQMKIQANLPNYREFEKIEEKEDGF